jgi:sarcosine oxidase gamma subunit
MDRRYNRQPFSTHQTFVVTKPFVMDGQHYVRGDLVPTDGIEPRRLRQMWDNRMIDAASAAPETPAQALQERAKPAAAPVARQKQESAPQITQEPPAARRVEHRGFGRYFVVDEGGKEHGPMSNDEAQAMSSAAA